jgi:hypothetical protein
MAIGRCRPQLTRWAPAAASNWILAPTRSPRLVVGIASSTRAVARASAYTGCVRASFHIAKVDPNGWASIAGRTQPRAATRRTGESYLRVVRGRSQACARALFFLPLAPLATPSTAQSCEQRASRRTARRRSGETHPSPIMRVALAADTNRRVMAAEEALISRGWRSAPAVALCGAQKCGGER